MKVRIAYTKHVSNFRRYAISIHSGQKRLATRQEVQDHYYIYGETVDDDMDFELSSMIDRLEEKVSAAWDKQTSSTPKDWSDRNPSRGQCVPTSLIIISTLGGQLMRCVVGDESHYYVRLPDGSVLDWTISQYSGLNPKNHRRVPLRRAFTNPDVIRRVRLLGERAGIYMGYLERMIKEQSDE